MPRAVRSARACPAVRRIIVVDNASHDQSATVAAQSGADHVIVSTTNAGFASAVNRGLGRTDAGRILLLNPDATIDSTALSLLCAALDRDPRVVLAGPLLVDAAGQVSPGAARFSTVTNRVGMCLPLVGRLPWLRPEDDRVKHVAQSHETMAVDYLWGAVVLADGSFLRAIGGLDERFFLFSEDEDLCRTARAQGMSVLLVGAARAAHLGGASSEDLALREARRLHAAGQLLEKWEGRGSAARYNRGIVAVFRLRELLFAAASRVACHGSPKAGEARRTRVLFSRMAANGRAE